VKHLLVALDVKTNQLYGHSSKSKKNADILRFVLEGSDFRQNKDLTSAIEVYLRWRINNKRHAAIYYENKTRSIVPDGALVEFGIIHLVNESNKKI